MKKLFLMSTLCILTLTTHFCQTAPPNPLTFVRALQEPHQIGIEITGGVPPYEYRLAGNYASTYQHSTDEKMHNFVLTRSLSGFFNITVTDTVGETVRHNFIVGKWPPQVGLPG